MQHTHTHMPSFLPEYFILSYALTLVLGFFQTPPTQLLPATDDDDDLHSPKLYGLVAVTLIGIQAVVSVAALNGTSAFPFAALFVAFTLLSHHTIIHRRSRFEGETCSCAPFQCKDVSNHETWVVAALVAAVVSQFGV